MTKNNTLNLYKTSILRIYRIPNSIKIEENKNKTDTVLTRHCVDKTVWAPLCGTRQEVIRESSISLGHQCGDRQAGHQHGPSLAMCLSHMDLPLECYCHTWTFPWNATVTHGPFFAMCMSHMDLTSPCVCHTWNFPCHVSVTHGPLLVMCLSHMDLPSPCVCHTWTFSFHVSVRNGPPLTMWLSHMNLPF